MLPTNRKTGERGIVGKSLGCNQDRSEESTNLSNDSEFVRFCLPPTLCYIAAAVG